MRVGALTTQEVAMKIQTIRLSMATAAATAVFTLSGCIVVPARPAYVAPAPVYVAPPAPVYVGPPIWFRGRWVYRH
jgi:hypothetical protein